MKKSGRRRGRGEGARRRFAGNGQGLRLGAQVKGVRSTVFWTVSIVSGLFIRGDAALLFSSTTAKTELRWCFVAV